MQIAFIALITWVAIVTTDIFGSIYLGHLRVDVEDNLLARKHLTQIRILKRAAVTIIALIGIASALMTFDEVRQYGVSIFASAGVAGLAIGLAARPLLSNLIAGVQIAMTQPIRIQDSVIVEGEYGTIEEITSTYVVVQLWDWRRMILPLNYFIEKPFQNWTRENSSIIGNVILYVDYKRDTVVGRPRRQPAGDRYNRDVDAASGARERTDGGCRLGPQMPGEGGADCVCQSGIGIIASPASPPDRRSPPVEG